jgi:hypothetical protein
MERYEGFKERQLRQVIEDYGRCHPADTLCAERQALKHEACEELDREEIERESLACFRAPGCDWAESCIEHARDRSEDRVMGCTLAKA